MEIIYIASAEIIKAVTTLHSNVENKLLEPEIKAVQDLHIHPLLGTALYSKILTDIKNGSLADSYKTLVDNYLIDCIANYVLSELPEAINYQFTNRGVQTKKTDNADTPSMSDMYAIVSKYKDRAEHYKERAKKYLIQNAPTKFPEYLNPGSAIDTVIPENTAFTCPIFLEDETYKGKSFSERYQGNKPHY